MRSGERRFVIVRCLSYSTQKNPLESFSQIPRLTLFSLDGGCRKAYTWSIHGFDGSEGPTGV